jgi:ABC-2 type transport system ATP-binding protein
MQIQATSLRKQYGDFELSIPDFTIPAGQTVGLVGNNGAGKTTLLRLVLDLIRADNGAVRIGGENVAQTFDWKRSTGSHLDDAFLIDFLTPDEFWAFVGSTYELSEDDVQRAVQPYAEFYTDEPIGRTTKYIRDLSQGNRKKVGVIAALLAEPHVVVLDEPFASLDPRSQIWLKNHLQEQHAAREVTMLISSHDLGHVTDVSDRIALLDGGAIVRDAQTTPDTLSELEAYFAREIRPANGRSAEARSATSG